jgi:hypothetical protein
MSDVIDRPVLDQDASGKSRLRIIDCDIHPSLHARSDLNPFLSKRWQEHLKSYGDHLRTPYIGTTPYPRSSPLIARRDAWPPTGGPPGSDLAFMRKQHLDPLDIEFGILQVLDMFIFSQQNLEFGARDPARHQRMAARALDQPGAAAEGRDPGRAGRHRGRRCRDRALREDRPVCPDQCLSARQRAAGAPPLLADLCVRARP